MKKTITILSIILLGACNNTGEKPPLENLDKKSAREVTLTTTTKGDTVYHLTKQIIWVNGEKIASKTDTIATALTPKTWSTDSTSIKLNQVPIYVTVQ